VPVMLMDRLLSRVVTLALPVALCLIFVPLGVAQDFVSAVFATHPVAFYRLESLTGKSQVGPTTYRSLGGVAVAAQGAPIGIANNHALKLDGHDGYIVTTQTGGVGVAASMMAWVNLSDLPSSTGHFFYVEGESQNGNDLDLQFEDDNALRFFTASGGNLSYSPPPSTLVNQWHMIVVTLDTATHTRAIYWDGKLAATDKGGGEAGKTGIFSVGASTVFGGRFFKGGIEEAALWNRALAASEVTAIYATVKPTAAPVVARSAPTSGTGPFATTAKVEAEDSKGPIAMKREEQIAMMFLTAIENIERDCQLRMQRACTMDELMAGTKPPTGPGTERLKFDPKVDPNYSYTFAAGGKAWEAHANAKKPGLMGFYYSSRGIGSTVTTYNRSGSATAVDTEITGRGIEGDSFATR
jgi:Concanavalin A-like lectin/glucanases superfamily